MSIGVTLIFNGNAKIILTASTEIDKTLLSAAFIGRVIQAVNPKDGSYEIVLVEKKEAE